MLPIEDSSGGGGEGRADRCTGRRRIDLGVAHNFPLRSPFDPASVYGNRSSSSLIVFSHSAPRPLACTSGHPQTKSRESESDHSLPPSTLLFEIFFDSGAGGWGTSCVRPGSGTHTGTWNESRLLQSVHVCTPPLVTKPHASCNACVCIRITIPGPLEGSTPSMSMFSL